MEEKTLLMITKIDITKFGLFNDFEWDKTFGKDTNSFFKKVNVIYGRNYSGKTTLARVLRCIEKGELNKNYIDGNFVVSLSDGTNISPSTLLISSTKIQLRVYNSDFIKDNLGWLQNEDGSIVPFTILGERNVEIDKKIKEIEEKIGKVEETKGLQFEYKESENSYFANQKKINQKKADLELKLKVKANDKIKVNSNFFIATTLKKTYQINDIKEEITKITANPEKYFLSENQKEDKIKLLKEQPLDDIKELPASKPVFSNYFATTKELLSKKIKPSKAIAELIEDSLLQEWVREGIDRHKNKRTTCGFCGNSLPKDIWENIDAHFSKESEDLRKNIKEQIQILQKVKQNINEFLKISRENFYSGLQKTFDKDLAEWIKLRNKYATNIDELIFGLNERLKNIFNQQTLIEITDISDDILHLLQEFNKLIKESNKKTTSLAKDQERARNDLRLAEIVDFIKIIDYKKKTDEIKSLEKEVAELEKTKNLKQSEIDRLSEQRRELEAKAQDESRGAELVNEHLSKFFGHDELKLVAEGEKTNMKFKITREKADAKNLNEGECSLISFCYFIAKMQDELNAETNNKKLIIYIDDPISSLDSNHIFFMFSLIDSIIAKPNKYDQLFISTHNLEFLKFLKQLTVPDNKNNIGHFLIERRKKKTDKRVFLVPMPHHLKKYVTEFNYLFSEIYKIYKETKGDRKTILENTYNQFYNLPNNIRKFLECYLFYKYPNTSNPLENLDKLFDGHIPSLVNRIVNEYSHLTYIDRGWKPIDVEEMEECAGIIIEKIKERDKDQFEALVASIS